MDDKFDQISLSELIHIIIKRRKLIALITLGFLVLGVIQAFVLTSTKYASEVTLQINNIESIPTQPVVNSAVSNLLDSITHAGDLDFDAYLNEVTSEEVLEKTIKDLKLESDFSSASLRSALSIGADPELKTIDLRLVTKDREEGVKIVNKISENFTEHITNISQENALQTLEVVQKQMQIEKEKYAEALKEYEDATEGIKSAQELKLEMEAVYEQLTTYKTNLNDLEIKKEGLEGAIKTTDSSNNSGMILRPSDSEGGYIYLDTSKKALETDLAETNARVTSTNKSIEKLQVSIERLKTEYQNIEFAESVIRQKVDLTKQSYEAFAMKYQELDMQTSIDVGGISVNTVSDAVPAQRPVGTRKIIKLAIFTMLGLITGVIASFVFEYLDIMKAKKIIK